MNLLEALLRGAGEGAARPALEVGDRVVSYDALIARAGALAVQLRSGGVARGDRVALVAPNGPEYVIAYFGILGAGGVVVPVNARSRAPEIRHVVRDSGARVAIVHADAAAEVQRGVTEVPGFARLLPLEDAVSHDAPTAGGTGRAVGLDPAAVRDDDLAQISYTSGTTGQPKGVMLTHAALARKARVTANVYGLVASDRMLAVAPLVHILGCTVVMNGPLRFGAALVFSPAPDADAVLRTIETQRCTVTALVPTLLILMRQHPRRYDLRSLRIALSGGAPCPPELLAAALHELGVLVLEGYGITELAGGVSLTPPRGRRTAGSVGPPEPEVEVVVLDDAGQPVAPGAVGELCVRGPSLMRGYHGQPEATAEVLVDGWYRTGDLGYLDPEGYLFIVDRKKDLVITSGFNVYPREVEDVLYEHSAVAEAGVVGLPDPVRGEIVCACVSLRAGATADAAELIAHCKERLLPYKAPARLAFFDALPKGASGKVLRRELRQLLAARAE